LFEDARSSIQKDLAGRSQAHAPIGPFHELGAEFRFQLPDLMTESGLRHVK